MEHGGGVLGAGSEPAAKAGRFSLLALEAQAQAAFDYVQTHAVEYGRLYGVYEMRKDTRDLSMSIAFQDAEGSSAKEREINAQTDEKYRNTMEQLQEDISKFKELQTRINLAHAKIEVWRTEQANNRRGVT